MAGEELFEFFKRTGSYSSGAARKSGSGRGRKRGRKKDRRSPRGGTPTGPAPDRTRRKKLARGRALDTLPESGARVSAAPGLAIAAVVLVVAGLLYGTYVVGRNHGATTLNTSAPASPQEEVTGLPGEQIEPVFSILVTKLEDTAENETLVREIRDNLIKLQYPDPEAVRNQHDNTLRIYVGRTADPEDPHLREFLPKLAEFFGEVSIIER